MNENFFSQGMVIYTLVATVKSTFLSKEYGHLYPLTHWGRVTHICVSKLGHHWFRQWLVAWPAPSHYLNQCWNIINWILGNKFQWNLNRNSYIFIQENAFENVVWEMAAILSRPQCVKYRPWDNTALYRAMMPWVLVLPCHRQPWYWPRLSGKD